MMMGLIDFKTSAALPGPPTLISLGQQRSTGGGTTQVTSGFTSTAAATRLVIITWTSPTYTNLTTGGLITPNVGTPVSLTVVQDYTDGVNLGLGIAYAVLLSDADTATTLTPSITYANPPFASSVFGMWTTLSTSLVSTAPTASNHATVATTATPSTTVAASANGFIIAAAISAQTTTNSCTISGDAGATFGSTTNDAFALGQHAIADTNNNTVSAATHTITGTFANSGSPGFATIASASWR